MIQLASFRAVNFRSLADVTLTDIPRYVLLYGPNDAGKSNILRAVGAWLRLLRRFYLVEAPRSLFAGNFALTWKDAVDVLGGPPAEQFRYGNHRMELNGNLMIALPSPASGSANYEFNVELKQAGGGGSGSGEHSVEVEFTAVKWPGREDGVLPIRQTSPEMSALLGALRYPWFHISADRRFHQEVFSPGTNSVREQELASDGSDLLRRLFHAFTGSSREHFHLFANRFAPSLRQSPFVLDNPRPVIDSNGLLDLLIDEHSVRERGSGARQWALLAGMIAMNSAGIIGIEEPEANLSWAAQEALGRWLLHELSLPALQLGQIFLTTHSPVMRGDSVQDAPWYLVERPGAEGTTVTRAVSAAGLDALFPPQPPVPARSDSIRLYSGNVFTLPSGMLAHLGVQPGQFLFPLPQAPGEILLVSERRMDELEGLSSESSDAGMGTAGDDNG